MGIVVEHFDQIDRDHAPAVNNFVKLEYQDTDWNGRTSNGDL